MDFVIPAVGEGVGVSGGCWVGGKWETDQCFYLLLLFDYIFCWVGLWGFFFVFCLLSIAPKYP